MNSLDSYVAELNSYFSKKSPRYERFLKFNVYFSPESEQVRFPYEFYKKSFESAADTFSKNFDANFLYNFSKITISMDVTPSQVAGYLDLFKWSLPKEKYATLEALTKEVILSEYDKKSRMEKVLLDYSSHFMIQEVPDEELNCVLYFQDEKSTDSAAMSKKGSGTFLINMRDADLGLDKILLHEISHIFGAVHDDTTPNIMRSQTDRQFITKWTLQAKELVFDGLKKFVFHKEK